MRVAITVPRGTPPGNLLVLRLQYPGSAIDLIDVNVPAGHAYLTGLQIFAGNRSDPIIPEPGSNLSFIVDDGNHIISRQHIEFDEPSFALVFKAYNLSTFYSHTFTVDLS